MRKAEQGDHEVSAGPPTAVNILTGNAGVTLRRCVLRKMHDDRNHYCSVLTGLSLPENVNALLSLCQTRYF
jgi:hypothetical protein